MQINKKQLLFMLNLIKLYCIFCQLEYNILLILTRKNIIQI